MIGPFDSRPSGFLWPRSRSLLSAPDISYVTVHLPMLDSLGAVLKHTSSPWDHAPLTSIRSHGLKPRFSCVTQRESRILLEGETLFSLSKWRTARSSLPDLSHLINNQTAVPSLQQLPSCTLYVCCCTIWAGGADDGDGGDYPAVRRFHKKVFCGIDHAHELCGEIAVESILFFCLYST